MRAALGWCLVTGLVGAAGVLSPVPLPSAAVSAEVQASVSKPRAPDHRTLVWRTHAPRHLVIGTSYHGRDIVARRLGSRQAPHVVLAIGQMHGNEPKGRAVVRELRARTAPHDVQIWTISTINPDGARDRRRTNGRGVDLNRNFPGSWRPVAGYYPGRQPASERETRATMRLLDRLRPDLVLSMHQAYRSVDAGNPKTGRWARTVAAEFGLPVVTVPCRGPCTGTMTNWFNSHYVGFAVTVELPPSSQVTPSRSVRYAGAVVRLARLLRG